MRTIPYPAGSVPPGSFVPHTILAGFQVSGAQAAPSMSTRNPQNVDCPSTPMDGAASTSWCRSFVTYRELGGTPAQRPRLVAARARTRRVVTSEWMLTPLGSAKLRPLKRVEYDKLVEAGL